MNASEPLQITIVNESAGAPDSSIPEVVLRGELDLSVCDHAWETIQPVVDPKLGLVLDLTEVAFIDSRGLTVLVRVLNTLDGGKLVLRGASPRILRLLEISGLRPRVVLN